MPFVNKSLNENCSSSASRLTLRRTNIQIILGFTYLTPVSLGSYVLESLYYNSSGTLSQSSMESHWFVTCPAIFNIRSGSRIAGQ